MTARVLATFLAFLLVWTGVFSHQDAAPAHTPHPQRIASQALADAADAAGSVDSHHLDDRAGDLPDQMTPGVPPQPVPSAIARPDRSAGPARASPDLTTPRPPPRAARPLA